MNAQPKERGIEETLRALEIDTTVDPETAARQAADAVDASTTVVVVTSGADDGTDEESYTPLPSDEELLMPLPNERTLIPAPKTIRGKQREKSPAAAKLGKDLASKMPGAEHIKVFKRESGKRWHISDFTKDDLALHTDMIGFLREYVVPDHGPGEYEMVGVDARGGTVQLGVERLRGKPTQSAENGVLEFAERILKETKVREEEIAKRAQESMAQQQSPLEILTGVLAVQEKLEEKRAAASAENGNGMTAMVQMFMAQSQQQSQMMIALLNKPKEVSPFEQMMMARLMKDFEGGGGSSSAGLPPPPPPPPPALDIAAILAALPGLFTAIAGLAAAFGGSGGGDDDFKEFLKELMLKKDGEQLGLRDTLLLVKELSGGTAKTEDSFTDAIDKTAKLMSFARNFQQQEGGGNATLWDAVTAFAGNRDFAGALAGTIRAKLDGKAGAEEQRLAAERQRLEMTRRALLRQNAQQQVDERVQAPTQTVVEQPPASAAPPTPERVQEAVANTGKIPALPPETPTHLSNLSSAPDDAARVKHMIEFLTYLVEAEDWKKFAESTLDAMRTGNRKATLYSLNAFLGTLVQIQLIEGPAAQAVFNAVAQNFDAIKVQLADFPLPKDEELTAENMTAGAEELVEAAEAAASPG